MGVTLVEFVKYVFVVVLGLLPIMNPLSTVPLFLALTKGMGAARKREQALRACLYALLVLITFLFLGNGIIAILGISLAGIRVAGGLIILVLAFRMLFASESESEEPAEDEAAEVKRAKLDFSFSPLAMPSLSGPGSIAVVMGYGSNIPDDGMALGYGIVVIGITLTVMVAYATLVGANWIARFLGEHGIQAVTKVMGFLLACVAVQFIASGVRDFVQTFS